MPDEQQPDLRYGGGAACVGCPGGESCSNGTCTCNGASCLGCCANGTCIALADETDQQCGVPGQTCAACPTCQTCDPSTGTWVSAKDSTACTTEYSQAGTCCGGQCTVTAYDHNNCGACGVQCPSNEGCIDSVCICGANPSCTNGTICCTTVTAYVCANPTSDPNHCGGCGTVCSSGGPCRDGVCCAGTPEATLCDGRCVNTQTDSANCGGCGAKCASGAWCSSGHCCDIGLTYCNGLCYDLQSDVNQCGHCGTVCSCTDVGAVCSGRLCCISSLGECGGCSLPCCSGYTCSAFDFFCP